MYLPITVYCYRMVRCSAAGLENIMIFRKYQISIYTVFQKKTCDHVFDDKLKQNCPFRKIFGTLITKSTGHRQVFLFSHLTYFVQLLYLGKLWKPKYQQKLNKITNILQEDVILIKNLYLSKQYSARRLLGELPDKGWKLWSIDSLLKRSHKTSTIVPLPGSVRLRLSRSSEKPCAQSGGQAKKALVSSLDFAWNCHNLFKCIQKYNSPFTCFKWCRAQLLSEANRISRLTHW